MGRGKEPKWAYRQTGETKQIHSSAMAELPSCKILFLHLLNEVNRRSIHHSCSPSSPTYFQKTLEGSPQKRQGFLEWTCILRVKRELVSPALQKTEEARYTGSSWRARYPQPKAQSLHKCWIFMFHAICLPLFTISSATISVNTCPNHHLQ